MRDHGKKIEDMYQTMPENKIAYPHVELPYEVIEGAKKYQPGDVVCIEVHIKIGHLSEQSVGGELLSSEVETEEEEKKEK